MSDEWPVNFDIRQFMYKLNKEKERINRITMNRARTMTGEERQAWADWEMQIAKLSSLCSSVISYSIDIQKRVRGN